MTALIGKKLGMTRIFNENGKSIPVTLIEVTPATVTQIKTTETDGYSAVQIHSYGIKKEFSYNTETDSPLEIGSKLDCSHLVAGSILSISGTSKGKGFSGVIKRHNFHRGPMSHGSHHHRKPGSIGAMFPQHVLKGQKMPGHHGNSAVSLKKVALVDLDLANNILFLKGPVPGSRGSLIQISQNSHE